MITQLVGIQVGSNLLFTLAILLLLALCIQLSLEVSSQEDKIRRLAEETAILRVQVESPARTIDMPQRSISLELEHAQRPTGDDEKGISL